MHKLLFAEAVHALRFKPIMISSAPEGIPDIVEAKDKRRQRLLMPVLRNIEQVQKFVFDSGTDRDAQTVDAVKETAVNMLQARLFRQPFPRIWIEDPFDDNPDQMRNFYLASETDKQIVVWFIQKMDLGAEFPAGTKIGGKLVPQYALHPYPMIIDLLEPSDEFGIDTRGVPVSGLYASILGEAIYAYKKFIVTLNAENIRTEKVRAAGAKRFKGDVRTKPYDYTLVTVPYDTDSGERGSGGTTGARRRHLVRGYLWGRNTRPVGEQRWVKPFFRGAQIRETVERTHYEVR